MGPSRRASLLGAIAIGLAVTTACGGDESGSGATTGGGGVGGTGAGAGPGSGGSGATSTSTGAGTAGAGGQGGQGGQGGGTSGTVPDPGTTEGGEWTDVEPNNDPSHAVPVGVLTGPVWMGFADPVTKINGPGDSDFFVFKTKDAA